MTKDNFVVIDCETGGLNPKETDLLSIGMVFVRDGNVTMEREWFIKKNSPYRVNPGAMSLNKFDWKDITEKGKDIQSVVFEFMTIMMNVFNCEGQIKPTVIGHNIDFDLGFIFEQAINKIEWEKLVSYRKVDTAGIGRFLIDCGIISGTKADLSSLAEEFGVPCDEDGDRHSALYDARLAWEVYKKMRLVVSEHNTFWKV